MNRHELVVDNFAGGGAGQSEFTGAMSGTTRGVQMLQLKDYAPVVKYPGAKWGIARKIIAYMPKHRSYLEPFFGSGAVLFKKQPSSIETINDLDNRVYNLFKMVRDNPDELSRLITMTPFSRYEYNHALISTSEDQVEMVRQFLVQCWQGFGFRVNDNKCGWKHDVQGREKAYALSNWNRLPGWIMDATERLKQVQITNEPALDLIKRFNYRNVLIYADPPYLLSERSGKQYAHEMNEADHIKLLKALLEHKGAVMLSGYESDLYNDLLRGWAKVSFAATAEFGLARQEVLWMNFKPIEQISFWE